MSIKPVLFTAAALIASAAATAQPVRPFSLAALQAAQAKGEPVLVDAFAPWCPTCRAQAPTIEALASNPAFAKLAIFRLDYDHQVAEKKALGIRQQSTLIAYHGRSEAARSVGNTAPADIQALAKAALGGGK